MYTGDAFMFSSESITIHTEGDAGTQVPTLCCKTSLDSFSKNSAMQILNPDSAMNCTQDDKYKQELNNVEIMQRRSTRCVNNVVQVGQMG